jgi:hypothetical protein
MYKVKQSEVKDLETTIASLGGSISIVNNLTNGGTTSALSAEQGKVLKTTIDGKKAVTQANSVATDVAGLVADFNALLAKLKSAGLMA